MLMSIVQLGKRDAGHGAGSAAQITPRSSENLLRQTDRWVCQQQPVEAKVRRPGKKQSVMWGSGAAFVRPVGGMHVKR